MKQKLALIPVLLLFGCSRIGDDLQTRLNEKVTEASSSEINYTNYSKDYYSYYLQPYVGRLNADATSNTFVLDNDRFVMNLNVSSVINEKERETYLLGTDTVSEADVSAYLSGTYPDAEGNEYPYEIKICRLSGRNAVIMHSPYFDLCGFCSENEAPEMAGEMMRIVRSTKINREAILAYYTYDEAISYTGKAVKLFEDISPENGSIEELFVDSSTTGNGIGGGFDEFTDDSQEYHEQIETDEAPEEETVSESEDES